MKKRYSLALWWWWAVWFAHIWVLKFLEENNIEILELSWTSMWALISSLYAIWKTSKEIEEIAKSINYLKLLDFDFWSWIFKWKKIYKKLEEFFWNTLIQDTKIPLKIVATDIESGWKMIFEKWKIVDAIRASISLPWVFKPHNINNHYYVDGGVVSNLPIEVLSWKDIIAVSASKQIMWELKKRKKVLGFDVRAWFFDINFQILQRSLLFLMKQNEVSSLNTKWKNIIFIKPDTKDIDIYSFNKVDEIIKRWYNEISNIL